MTTPYTYCLTHVPSGRRYYGVRYARGCDPKELFVSYFSSSKYVKQLLEQGDEFKAEVRKTFDTKLKAIDWEERVLRKLGIPNNKSWLNANVAGARGISANCHLGPKKGRKLPPVSDKARENMRLARYRYLESVGGVGPCRGKKMPQSFIEKRRAFMTGSKASDETKEKMKRAASNRKRCYREDGSWYWIQS